MSQAGTCLTPQVESTIPVPFPPSLTLRRILWMWKTMPRVQGQVEYKKLETWGNTAYLPSSATHGI